jgi:hypothetical protein
MFCDEAFEGSTVMWQHFPFRVVGLSISYLSMFPWVEYKHQYTVLILSQKLSLRGKCWPHLCLHIHRSTKSSWFISFPGYSAAASQQQLMKHRVTCNLLMTELISSKVLRPLQRKSLVCMYSFSGNCATSVPFSTLMCLWVIYIFPESVHIQYFLRQSRQIHRGI